MGTLCHMRPFCVPKETERIKPYTRAIENGTLDEFYRLRDKRLKKKREGGKVDKL